MNSNKSNWIIMIVTIIIVIFLVFDHYNRNEVNKAQIKRIDSLGQVNKKLFKFDSIQSANLNRFLDSLSIFRSKLENEKTQRNAQNLNLIKKTNDLNRRFDSIILPDRPDF